MQQMGIWDDELERRKGDVRYGGFYILPCQVDVANFSRYVFSVQQIAEDEAQGKLSSELRCEWERPLICERKKLDDVWEESYGQNLKELCWTFRHDGYQENSKLENWMVYAKRRFKFPVLHFSLHIVFSELNGVHTYRLYESLKQLLHQILTCSRSSLEGD